MKKFLLFGLIAIGFWLMPVNRTDAQKNNGDRVTIQIIRDGKIVSDTTIQLKEGQDPEAVKKYIANVLEGDVQVISGKEGHQKIVHVITEDDQHMHHSENIDVNIDTCKKHKELVMVNEGDKPHEIHKKVIVKEVPGGEKSEETVIIEGGDEFEISEGDEGGSKVIIITEKGDKESDGHQKKIRVYVTEGDSDVEILDDEGMELHKGKEADSVDVYIIKNDDGTKVIKKVKKVEVTVKEESGSNQDPAQPSAEPAIKPDRKK